MAKVVVLGGAGFMGSHTADVLTDRGFDVTIFDNRPPSLIRDDQTVVVGDVLDEEFKQSCRRCKVSL